MAALLVVGAFTATAEGATVTLAWNHNTEPNIAGYRVYFGTASHSYTSQVDVGNITSATLSNLAEGTTYYFAATAYNTLDVESTFSSELVYATSQTPTPTPTPSPALTPTPTRTPSPTPTPTRTPSPTPTHTPSATPSASPSPAPTHTPSPTPTHTPSATPSPSASPASTHTPSPTPSSTPSASPDPTPVPTNTPSPSPSPSSTPAPSPAPSPSASPIPSPTPSSTPSPPEQPELLNISTRLFVPPNSNAMIGGFIIYGDSPKRVLLRAIGPSLASFAIPEPMSDPALRVFDSSGSLIASNDNWRSDQAQLIQQSGLAPSNDLEPALLLSLPQGFYSAVVYDVNNSPGVALFEFYDLDPSSSQLLNLSTRGSLLTLDRVLIGGFVTYGNQPITFLLRALGPSLASAGVPDPLLDPSLQLFDSQGVLIFQNDNWRSDQEQQILATHFAPTDERESAIVASLPPGSYTALVHSVDNSTGTVLFEIYRLPAQ